jgi:hypothetical protein
MKRLRTRISNLFSTTWGVVAVMFLFLLGIALTALILSALLWPKQGCNSPICMDCNSSCVSCNSTCLDCNSTCLDCNSTCLDCNTTCQDCVTLCSNGTGKIETIFTDNTTLIVNGSLSIHGLCGIKTDIDSDGNLTITNLREISKYIVGQDNCSEFATPQEAYNQAVLDGKGGDGGPGATIIIKPGIYDFGDTLFPITESGITFFGLPGEKVIFSSTATTGGISVTLPTNVINVVTFNGITFGEVDSTTGFLLDIETGLAIITNCACLNSNFRIRMGGGVGGTSLVIRNSILNTLPPDDFIIGLGPDITILFENVNMFIAAGTVGGHIISIPFGCQNVTLFRAQIWVNYYDGVIAGPLSGADSTPNIVLIRYTFTTQTIFVNPTNHIILQNGKINVNIQFNNIFVVGFVVYQNVDSVTSDVHGILISNNYIETGNSTIRTADTVTVIGSTNFIDFASNWIRCDIVGEFIHVLTATAGDNLFVRLLTTILTTTASGPGGVYATGPAGLSTLTLGNSIHTGQADTANGFAIINLVEL